MPSLSVCLLFLGLIIAIPGTNQISTNPEITCDTDFTDLTYSITPLICPGECWRQYDRNQLCGLGKYSGGSICLAAMQLGLVDNFGGFATVYKNMNVSLQPVGGSRNAVTSHNCSRSKVSYTFDITCDTNGNVMQDLNEATCPPGCGGGLVLGSNPYHVNSSICSAAVHAGKVTKENGGEVTFFKLHDVRSNLNGSLRNGVKSVGSSRSSVNIFTFGFFNECELATKVCQNNATCHDIKYGFGCSCTPGFQGRLCDADINECRLAGSCHTNAVCYNTKGSFICTCNAGYNGDGKICTDIDECGLAGSCHTNAACNNTKGSFICSCNAGYSGDGKNCTDIDECGLMAGSCHANATCNNTKGSFTCNCKFGYSGDGKNCTAFYCNFAPTVSGGGSATPTLPAPPGYHGNTVVTSLCGNRMVSAYLIKTSECSATNTWTPASLFCINVESCYAGVKDGRVKDSQMTASSISENRFPPTLGRLDGPKWWMPKTFGPNDPYKWLQVDFLANKTIYGVVTQAGQHWGFVTKFEISYSDDETSFQVIKDGSTTKVFSGNWDHYSQKINRFPYPVSGRYFRLYVLKYASRPACRLEYLLC